ncbi:hypothetical protein HAX54_002569 [Datura stramonium]|uniref:Uncharacterized protein n=1 Tax=Datura stramonium TaxID=4076 RepID=A0ABS8WRD6_DATST|nr:hypothetical protein [Datura stramonium]
MVRDIMGTQNEDHPEKKKRKVTIDIDMANIKGSHSERTVTSPFTQAQPSTRPHTSTEVNTIKLSQLVNTIDAEMTKLEQTIPEISRVALAPPFSIQQNELVELSDRVSRLQASWDEDLTALKANLATIRKKIVQLRLTNLDFLLTDAPTELGNASTQPATEDLREGTGETPEY